MSPSITIALADDHTLLRKGLSTLLQEIGFIVLFEANNGIEFIVRMQQCPQPPDVVLMDINMPEKNGYETTQWVTKHYPAVRVLALSMYDDEQAINRMMQSGAHGFLLKDSDPAVLQGAIEAVIDKGFYLP
jgi:DNA-binding NarL/FixJ family response regulator